MVSIVVPEPQKLAASNAEPPVSQNSGGILPFSVPDVTAARLALVTPSFQPLQPIALPSPFSGRLEKPASVPISVPGVAAKEHSSKPAIVSKDLANVLPTSPRRVNKFVRRLHDMLQAEKNSGIVEWRRGLLVLHSTDAFAKKILPRYFNTKNFKTLRRQLNYYGFVHVRSFSTTGSATTALWVNQDLANRGTDDISSVLMLKRVDPCDTVKSAEARRRRKELAASTVEDDIGVTAKSLQMEQIRSMARRRAQQDESDSSSQDEEHPNVPLLVHSHGTNYTQTTLEGGPLGTSTTWFTLNGAESSSSEETAESDDDAANLLLSLKSNVSS